MPAFADYLDLRFAVGDLVGNRDLSDVMPRLVQMAEAEFNRRLRTRKQITEDTLTFTDGAATLPSDFLEMISTFDGYGDQLRGSSIGTTRREGTQYNRYSITGSEIVVKGVSGDRDILYFAAIPTLTTSPTTSNWLLADAPDVYLYGVSVEAAKHIRDMDAVNTIAPLMDRAISLVETADLRARWGNATVRYMGLTP